MPIEDLLKSNFKRKSGEFFKWILYLPPMCDATFVSENFMLEGINCNFRYETHHKLLHCESCLPLKTEVDIRIIFTDKDKSYVSCCRFAGEKKEIWSSNDRHWGSLEFEFIIFSKTLNESLDFEECEVNSYLDRKVHFQAVCKDFSKLLDDSSSYDVVITCEDKIFHAHKIFLESRSPALSAMLKSNMVEDGKSDAVQVKEIKKCIFEYFLRYLYSGVLPNLSMEYAKELYKVGDQYDVKELKKACSEFMYKYLNGSNACDVLVLADHHNDSEFRKMVINFIVAIKLPGPQMISEYESNWSEFCKSSPFGH